VLYATLSQVSDIKLQDSDIVLVFNALTLKEECEKKENIDKLYETLKEMNLHYHIVCKSEIVKTDNNNIIQVLKDEFGDLLVIQNKNQGEENV